MFVAFMGNPYPGIYISTNIYTSICLICGIHYQQKYLPTNQENFGYPQTLTPMNNNDSTVSVMEMTYDLIVNWRKYEFWYIFKQ